MDNIYEIDKKYLPKRSESDEPLETPDEYYKRVKMFLPNIPEEVLKEFFYKHWELDIEDHAWLDYKTLSFFKESWTSSFIYRKSGVINNERVLVDKENHFESGYLTPRTESIRDYLLKYHTWPGTPILLYNPENNMLSPSGYKYTSPYHPIDGNNRLAIFLSLYENGQIKNDKKHLVWVVRTREYQ